jgi:hypothetical protein
MRQCQFATQPNCCMWLHSASVSSPLANEVFCGASARSRDCLGHTGQNLKLYE